MTHIGTLLCKTSSTVTCRLLTKSSLLPFPLEVAVLFSVPRLFYDKAPDLYIWLAQPKSSEFLPLPLLTSITPLTGRSTGGHLGSRSYLMFGNSTIPITTIDKKTNPHPHKEMQPDWPNIKGSPDTTNRTFYSFLPHPIKCTPFQPTRTSFLWRYCTVSAVDKQKTTIMATGCKFIEEDQSLDIIRSPDISPRRCLPADFCWLCGAFFPECALGLTPSLAVKDSTA
jgi:hypothetical protein